MSEQEKRREVEAVGGVRSAGTGTGQDSAETGASEATAPATGQVASQNTSRVWQDKAARCDVALAATGLARSRSHAAELIAAETVQINGETATKSGQRVQQGDLLELTRADRYVSRAAQKLVAALAHFEVPVAGRVALDLGASTGGFTQVLCENGALQVVALDVGHDQLAARVREMPQVVAVEGYNARNLTAGELDRVSGVAEPVSLVVGDLSFISLRLILPAIARTAEAGADIVLLIKPQFEVGPGVAKGGIVQRATDRAGAVREVLACAAGCGFALRGLELSPVEGNYGNREFLAWWVFGGAGQEATGVAGADNDAENASDLSAWFEKAELLAEASVSESGANKVRGVRNE
ncbi:MAG: TlyA family RNA methyltransferase [Microbacteriaceae bacterium]|nr:TlyA family RNA methyltransferase [Microbacteriaceae bacterium]